MSIHHEILVEATDWLERTNQLDLPSDPFDPNSVMEIDVEIRLHLASRLNIAGQNYTNYIRSANR